MIKKISTLYKAIIGIILKVWYTVFGFHKKNNVKNSTRDKQIIVSLTSYGRRVKKVLPFTLISLLKQQLKPDRIIVWLDNKKWSSDNLPKSLKKIEKSGVEFRFCEDIRSYTKLVPALIAFPSDIIITVDDDIYYRSDLIKKLYDNYLLHPNKIHAAIAHKPERDHSGALIEYNKWPKNIISQNNKEIFPTGVGGCLYPPGSLYADVTKKELFQRLCPMADDVWFWVMAKLQNTEHELVNTKPYYPLDLIYEKTHSGASLRQENVYQNANDIQIKQALSHYGLK